MNRRNFIKSILATMLFIPFAGKVLASNKVDCCFCNHCLRCPLGINIPRIFSMYNDYIKTGNKNMFKADYERLEKGHRAENCIKCSYCNQHCKKKINIPAQLAKISQVYHQLG